MRRRLPLVVLALAVLVLGIVLFTRHAPSAVSTPSRRPALAGTPHASSPHPGGAPRPWLAPSSVTRLVAGQVLLDGKPAPGARVDLRGTAVELGGVAKAVTTDDEGRFAFEPVPE